MRRSGKVILYVLTVLILFALIIVTQRVAEAQEDNDHLQKTRPEMLYTFVNTAGCPFENDEAKAEVDGVLVRSRLKPIDREAWLTDDSMDLSLVVYVNCGGGLYHIQVTFSDVVTVLKPKGLIPMVAHYEPIRQSYGTMNDYESKKVLGIIRSTTEDAITPYLRANFDL